MGRDIRLLALIRKAACCDQSFRRLTDFYTPPNILPFTVLWIPIQTSINSRFLQQANTQHEIKTIIPLNATLDRLLVWCNFLGSPVEEEALKVRDEWYDIRCFCSLSCSPLFTGNRMEHILDQLSKAILSAIDDTRTHQKSIRHMSCDLVRLGNRPERSAGMAYEWCSVICENHERLQVGVGNAQPN